MIYLIITLFAAAAVLGLIVLLRWTRKVDGTATVIYSHGIAAATGLGLLAWYAIQHPENYPQLSLILFVIGALGGFYLFFVNLRTKAKPVGMGMVHALVGVAAFIALLFFAFT
ncbi:MAG TPA: hypothetical protein PKW06_09035 [Cyclobacteriaceae bacterium]|nr:hypothetical protein [Cyclobacteriaceae bacterium]MCB9238534.1 hypothetical protein [Flammeovirgaceae bacterium]MCB0499726.1 hypothetical protein [Cyclobacteriaceae bacterium]MCO5272871.1 hypothetical protein [Cyclobacteriaceae bacterium]MCW5902421.1 hypothetical protein [Cyclobacteriaceae bacterium]